MMQTGYKLVKKWGTETPNISLVETIPELKVSEIPIDIDNSENSQADSSQSSDVDDPPEMSALKYVHKFLTLARKITSQIKQV